MTKSGEVHSTVDEVSSVSSVAAAGREARSRRNLSVTYWTGWLSPEMEGCSREVFALKDHFPRSRVFGFSRYYKFRASFRARYFGLNLRLYPIFRAIAPFVEARSEINHIYGSLREWFFLRALGRRPTIITVAIAKDAPFALEQYRRVAWFVSHSTGTTRSMIGWGFDPARISQIYPGTDLQLFRPGPRTAALRSNGPTPDPARFRIVYATTPNWLEGIKLKGVDLIIDAARRLPDVDFYLLWRPWTGADRLVAPLMKQKPSNVHILIGVIPDMVKAYQAADATIAPFLVKAEMKTCPTSLVESLACGTPLLVSTNVGICDLIQDRECGVVFEPTVDDMCAAIVKLQDNHAHFASRARACAEDHFDQEECLRAHERLYEQVLASC